MDIFIVNQDNPAAESLMLKLAKKSKPGAIIPLSTKEMDLYRSDDFSHVCTGTEQSPLNAVKVDLTDNVIFVIDQTKVNVDDIITTGERLGISYSVIRVST